MDLNAQLENKAEKKGRDLYYKKISSFYKDFMETFGVSELEMQNMPATRALYDLRWNETSREVWDAVAPFYKKAYIAEFISHVEKAQELLEELND